MTSSIKYAFFFFLGVLGPITIVNATYLYFTNSCDPKFGCWGTFQLLTMIVACCSLIAAFAVFLSFYFFVVNKNNFLSKNKKTVAVLIAVMLSLSTYYAVALMESIDIVGTAFLYFFVPLVLNSLILGAKKI